MTPEVLVLEERRKDTGQANTGVHSSYLETGGYAVIIFKKKVRREEKAIMAGTS